jgi:hypothetical protein
MPAIGQGDVKTCARLRDPTIRLEHRQGAGSHPRGRHQIQPRLTWPRQTPDWHGQATSQVTRESPVTGRILMTSGPAAPSRWAASRVPAGTGRCHADRRRPYCQRTSRGSSRWNDSWPEGLRDMSTAHAGLGTDTGQFLARAATSSWTASSPATAALPIGRTRQQSTAEIDGAPQVPPAVSAAAPTATGLAKSEPCRPGPSRA